MAYKSKNLTQVIISNKAKVNLDCHFLNQSKYNLYVCVSPRIIKMAEKLPAGEQIIQRCCGNFDFKGN